MASNVKKQKASDPTLQGLFLQSQFRAMPENPAQLDSAVIGQMATAITTISAQLAQNSTAMSGIVTAIQQISQNQTEFASQMASIRQLQTEARQGVGIFDPNMTTQQLNGTKANYWDEFFARQEAYDNKKAAAAAREQEAKRITGDTVLTPKAEAQLDLLFRNPLMIPMLIMGGLGADPNGGESLIMQRFRAMQEYERGPDGKYVMHSWDPNTNKLVPDPTGTIKKPVGVNPVAFQIAEIVNQQAHKAIGMAHEVANRSW